MIVSALVPYKRIEVAIEAAAGQGAQDRGQRSRPPHLERLSGSDVEFSRPPHYEQHPRPVSARGVHADARRGDFGIVPVESQACGRPVIALGRGGARETVVPWETGVLVDEPTPGAFADAIAASMNHAFDPIVIRRHAERFGRARFGDEMSALIAEHTAC